ncbi:hypothetical protein [Nocardia acidivorans]|uniref:hypothetical protein n=1 Tax=Nocardia acidivorans TaxID=404580 RepID=UPI000834CBAB|nr:hypothetical protein [Nocardia acidivorans]
MTNPDFGPALPRKAPPPPRGLPLPNSPRVARLPVAEDPIEAEQDQAETAGGFGTDSAQDQDYDDSEYDDSETGDYDAEYDAAQDQDYEEDYDDETDYDFAEDPNFNPVATTARRVGSWDSWLARPTNPGPHATRTADGDYQLPDYDAMNKDGAATYSDAARTAFTDRSGGRGAAVRARLHRKDPDQDAEGHPVFGGRNGLMAVLVAVGLVLVLSLIIIVNVRHASPLAAPASTAPHPAAVTSAPTGPAVPESYAHATPDCYATKTATTVVGAGPGDPSTGPGAILGFEWAYYSDRSGARARDWVSTDAAVPDAAAIQAGIDTVPVTTRYCVHITRADGDATGGTWNVLLSEQYPTDKTPVQYTQTITTRTDGGRTLITSIRPNS